MAIARFEHGRDAGFMRWRQTGIQQEV